MLKMLKILLLLVGLDNYMKFTSITPLRMILFSNPMYRTNLALFAFIFFLCACNKSGDDVSSVPGTIPMLSKVIYYEDNKVKAETDMTYDAHNRLIKLTMTGGYVEDYLYEPDRIIRNTNYFNNGLYTDTLVLNVEGMVIYETLHKASHEYSPEGYRTGEFAPYGNFTNKVLDGNTVLKCSWIKRDSVLIETNEYTYLPDQPNTIGNENMGITFYGKQDKNLLTRDKYTFLLYDQWEEIKQDYNYEFDKSNRVKKRINNIRTGCYWLYTYTN